MSKFGQQLHHIIQHYVKFLQRFTDRLWYPPLLTLLAALDNLLVVIPNDGILISSSMSIPRRWFFFATFVAIGSTIGAMVLAILVEYHGLPWAMSYFPGVEKSTLWQWCIDFFQSYGLLMVFLVSVTPFTQQPAVILAAASNVSYIKLAAVIFLGRYLKFLVMAYLGSHAPTKLAKLWGMKHELEDVGIDIKIK